MSGYSGLLVIIYFEDVLVDVIQNFVLSHFLSVKAAHIISAFLWSFTTISPMLFYVNPTMKKLKANPDDPELKRRGEWVLEQMDRVVILEHIALAVLLITGLMLYASGVASFASGWFFCKDVDSGWILCAYGNLRYLVDSCESATYGAKQRSRQTKIPSFSEVLLQIPHKASVSDCCIYPCRINFGLNQTILIDK